MRGLLRLTGNPRLAWDSYRRLVQSFAEVVHHVAGDRFEAALAERLRGRRVPSARELDFHALKALAEDYLELYERARRHALPAGPARPARGRGAGGVPLVARREGGRLPAHERLAETSARR